MKSLLPAGLTFVALLAFAATSQAGTINGATISGGNINYFATQGGTYLQNGDFLTIYDAGESPFNLAGDFADPTLFQISMNLTDTPAPGITVTDSPTITNLRFTYIGSTNLADTSLGSFSLVDPSGLFRYVSADGTAHIPSGQVNYLGPEIAPILPAPTPEPSTLALLTTGMLGLLGTAKRRFMRS